MNGKQILVLVFILLGSIVDVDCGLGALIAGYGACQTACNVAWVTCCTTAGITAGTVTAGAGAPAAVLACNGLQGVCMASCAASFLVAPTP